MFTLKRSDGDILDNGSLIALERRIIVHFRCARLTTLICSCNYDLWFILQNDIQQYYYAILHTLLKISTIHWVTHADKINVVK